jgi:ADP-ribose pyrophosphatase YjhB (NUDIX family)
MSRGDATRKRLSEAIAAALADLEELSGAEERYRAASWLVDHLADAISAAGKLRAQSVVALREEENLSLAQLGERLGLSKARTADIVRDIARAVGTHEPELKPVVSAIVTSQSGVLAVRRRDKNALWTFPCGEIEPGETAAQAGVRETREETGLEVVVGRILGRRTDPLTSRRMIYVAARPAKQSNVDALTLVNKGHLDEARWLSRAEVSELIPDAYEPVLAYLERDHRRHRA